MRTQEHNQGKLKGAQGGDREGCGGDSRENVKTHQRYPWMNLVVIALKRFCASHSDYDNKTPLGLG